MKIGTIVRNRNWIGVVTNSLPDGRTACMFGNELMRFPIAANPSAFTAVEIIDMTPIEHEDVLHLMQVLVFTLMENNEPF